MRLPFKQLRSLAVKTVSGIQLGHVADAIIETDGQFIAQYVVKSSRLSSKELLIHHDQVVRFTEDKMIVADTVAPIPAEKKDMRNVSPEPVAMRDTGN